MARIFGKCNSNIVRIWQIVFQRGHTISPTNNVWDFHCPLLGQNLVWPVLFYSSHFQRDIVVSHFGFYLCFVMIFIISSFFFLSLFHSLSSWYWSLNSGVLITELHFQPFLFCFKTGSHYVAQTGLKLMILFPQPPE